MLPLSAPEMAMFPPGSDHDVWLPPTLSQVLAALEPAEQILLAPSDDPALTAQRQWQTAIAALSALLKQLLPPSLSHSASPQPKGLVLSGPSAVVSDPCLTTQLSAWVFLPVTAYPLLPPTPTPASPDRSTHTVSLLAEDPLSEDQFCLVLTREFSLLLTLGKTVLGQYGFQYSFSPQTIRQAWQILRSRLLLARPDSLALLEQLYKVFPIPEPDYRIVSQFGRLLLSFSTQGISSQVVGSEHEILIPTPSSSSPATRAQPPEIAVKEEKNRLDIELLQAFSHEVRTPLATIRTLTSLVLKRHDLPAEATKRLEAIRRECTEQIDRFNLIFRAAEFVTSPASNQTTGLSSVCLTEVLHDRIPRWQQQAARRNLSLEVLLPPHLPAVVSDPVLLDQVLTGLIAHFGHGLPAGSNIQFEVTLAGNQLKLQLRSPHTSESNFHCQPLKSVGQVLMLQPETGNLSLSLSVTKNLFQVLGAKLTVRKGVDQGEILTLFLPLGNESQAY